MCSEINICIAILITICMGCWAWSLQNYCHPILPQRNKNEINIPLNNRGRNNLFFWRSNVRRICLVNAHYYGTSQPDRPGGGVSAVRSWSVGVWAEKAVLLVCKNIPKPFAQVRHIWATKPPQIKKGSFLFFAPYQWIWPYWCILASLRLA